MEQFAVTMRSLVTRVSVANVVALFTNNKVEYRQGRRAPGHPADGVAVAGFQATAILLTNCSCTKKMRKLNVGRHADVLWFYWQICFNRYLSKYQRYDQSKNRSSLKPL